MTSARHPSAVVPIGSDGSMVSSSGQTEMLQSEAAGRSPQVNTDAQLSRVRASGSFGTAGELHDASWAAAFIHKVKHLLFHLFVVQNS